jgi:hypothetical protein
VLRRISLVTVLRRIEAVMASVGAGIAMFVVSPAAPVHAAVVDETPAPPATAEIVTFTLQPTNAVNPLSGGAGLPHINCYFYMEAPRMRTDLGTGVNVASTATTHCQYDDGTDALEDTIDHDHQLYLNNALITRWHLPVYGLADNVTVPPSPCRNGQWSSFINLEIKKAGYNSLYWSETKYADITCPIPPQPQPVPPPPPGGGGGGPWGGCAVTCPDGSGGNL